MCVIDSINYKQLRYEFGHKNALWRTLLWSKNIYCIVKEHTYIIKNVYNSREFETKEWDVLIWVLKFYKYVCVWMEFYFFFQMKYLKNINIYQNNEKYYGKYLETTRCLMILWLQEMALMVNVR